EKYDKSYAPLTDDQRSAMNEADIKLWEDKAKTGLLRNDPTLQKIVRDLRMQLIDPVAGVSISLSSIGIASQSYTDQGKLTINETKLKQAILKDPDSVMSLFSKQSTTLPDYDRKATMLERTPRFKEEGIANRLFDIIQDNISIMMDSSKKKGYLLEKAGMAGDSTDLTSSMSKLINDETIKVADWEIKLSKKEDAYLRKFSKMETALNKFNSQSSWIASQLSGSN
ncbi:MAG: flagellar filament capping protein FliD, partial [Hyphomonadaceae bacterium]|nr:flagellar filament capping protein FliD [Clostridia bacterium]